MHNVLPGDVLAFGGRSCVSRLIRFCSLGPVSHVGLIVRNPLTYKLFCSEALCDSGLTLSPIASCMTTAWKCGERVWHYALTKPLLQPEIARLWQLALDVQGVPYDYSDVWLARTLGFGWLRHLAGRSGRLQEYSENGRLFCSEWVALAFDRMGLDVIEYPSHWSPTWFCRREVRIGTLKKPRLVRPGTSFSHPKGGAR